MVQQIHIRVFLADLSYFTVAVESLTCICADVITAVARHLRVPARKLLLCEVIDGIEYALDAEATLASLRGPTQWLSATQFYPLIFIVHLLPGCRDSRRLDVIEAAVAANTVSLDHVESSTAARDDLLVYAGLQLQMQLGNGNRVPSSGTLPQEMLRMVLPPRVITKMTAASARTRVLAAHLAVADTPYDEAGRQFADSVFEHVEHANAFLNPVRCADTRTHRILAVRKDSIALLMPRSLQPAVSFSVLDVLRVVVSGSCVGVMTRDDRSMMFVAVNERAAISIVDVIRRVVQMQQAAAGLVHNRVREHVGLPDTVLASAFPSSAMPQFPAQVSPRAPILPASPVASAAASASDSVVAARVVSFQPSASAASALSTMGSSTASSVPAGSSTLFPTDRVASSASWRTAATAPAAPSVPIAAAVVSADVTTVPSSLSATAGVTDTAVASPSVTGSVQRTESAIMMSPQRRAPPPPVSQAPPVSQYLSPTQQQRDVSPEIDIISPLSAVGVNVASAAMTPDAARYSATPQPQVRASELHKVLAPELNLVNSPAVKSNRPRRNELEEEETVSFGLVSTQTRPASQQSFTGRASQQSLTASQHMSRLNQLQEEDDPELAQAARNHISPAPSANSVPSSTMTVQSDTSSLPSFASAAVPSSQSGVSYGQFASLRAARAAASTSVPAPEPMMTVPMPSQGLPVPIVVVPSKPVQAADSQTNVTAATQAAASLDNSVAELSQSYLATQPKGIFSRAPSYQMVYPTTSARPPVPIAPTPKAYLQTSDQTAATVSIFEQFQKLRQEHRKEHEKQQQETVQSLQSHHQQVLQSLQLHPLPAVPAEEDPSLSGPSAAYIGVTIAQSVITATSTTSTAPPASTAYSSSALDTSTVSSTASSRPRATLPVGGTTATGVMSRLQGLLDAQRDHELRLTQLRQSTKVAENAFAAAAATKPPAPPVPENTFSAAMALADGHSVAHTAAPVAVDTAALLARYKQMQERERALTLNAQAVSESTVSTSAGGLDAARRQRDRAAQQTALRRELLGLRSEMNGLLAQVAASRESVS